MYVDSLSWLSISSIIHIEDAKKELVRDVDRLAWSDVHFVNYINGGIIFQSILKSFLVLDYDWVEKYGFWKIHCDILQGEIHVLRYQGWLCFLNVYDLKQQFLSEDHNFLYFIHMGAIKMCLYLLEVCCMNIIKNDMSEFVIKCPSCQKANVEHQKGEILL